MERERTGEVHVADAAREVVRDGRRAAAGQTAVRAARVAVRAPARAHHRLRLRHVLSVQCAEHCPDLMLHSTPYTVHIHYTHYAVHCLRNTTTTAECRRTYSAPILYCTCACVDYRLPELSLTTSTSRVRLKTFEYEPNESRAVNTRKCVCI